MAALVVLPLPELGGADDADWCTQRVYRAASDGSEDEGLSGERGHASSPAPEDDEGFTATMVHNSPQRECGAPKAADIIELLDDEDEENAPIVSAAPAPAIHGVSKKPGTIAAAATSATKQTTLVQHQFQRNALAVMMNASRSPAPAASPAIAAAKPPGHGSAVGRGGGPAMAVAGRGAPIRQLSAGRGGGGGGGGGFARSRGSLTAPRAGPCPFYKKVPGTPIAVDAFQYGPAWAAEMARAGRQAAFILTHFHSDHYGGLTKHWDSGVIWCTAVTAALVQLRLHVRSQYIRIVPLDAPVDVGHGTTMTFIDANHCPGAVLALFTLSDGRKYLHSGDMRWHPNMMQHPALRALVPPARGGTAATAAVVPPRLTSLFLDTTYASPQYSFPPQEAAVAAVVSIVRRYAHDRGALFVFGTYHIGKERLFMAVAHALGEPVYVDLAKARTLACFDWPRADRELLTTDPSAARIHVVPMGHLGLGRLQQRLKSLREAAEAVMRFAPAGNAATAVRSASLGTPTTPASAFSQAAAAVPTGRYLGKGRFAGQPRTRGRGRGASTAAYAAAAARAALVPASSTVSECVDLPDDVEFESESASPAPCAFAEMMSGAASLTSRAAADAAAKSRFGPIHSIVAFRPTGWAHKQENNAGEVEQMIEVNGASVAGSESVWGRAADDDKELPAAAGTGAAAATTMAHGVTETRGGGRSGRTTVLMPVASEDTAALRDPQSRVLAAGAVSGAGAQPAPALAAPAPPIVPEDDSDDDALFAAVQQLERQQALRRSAAEAASAAAARAAAQRMQAGAAAPATYSVRVTCSNRDGGAVTFVDPPTNAAGAAADRFASGAKRRREDGSLPIGGVSLFSVPYSEHSSFSELKQCVAFLQPLSIVPTVNCRSKEDAEQLVALLKAP